MGDRAGSRQIGSVDTSQEIAAGVDSSIQRAGLLSSLKQELDAHHKSADRESWLGVVVNKALSPFEKDADTGRAVQRLYDEARQTKDSAKLEELRQQSEKAIQQDKSALSWTGELEGYGAGFIKTAGLFMQSRLGLAATVGAYGLDQTKVNDSAGQFAADFGLGAVKAAGMRTMFKAVGETDWNFAFKGMALGGSSRLLDLGLNRQSYMNNGRFDLAQGLGRVKDGLLDGNALANDIVVFGAAGGASGALNAAFGGMLERNPRLATMLSGTSFGITSGGMQEFQREQDAGEALDFGRVLKHALVQGALDTVAAAPGAALAPDMMISQSAQSLNEAPVRFASKLPLDELVKAAAKMPEELEAAIALRSLAPNANVQPFYRADVEPQTRLIEDAVRGNHSDPRQLRENVLDPLAHDLANDTNDYNWRTFMGSQLIRLEAEGSIPKGSVDLSSLELPVVKMDAAEQTYLRGRLESGLRNEYELRNLLGYGEMGQKFPEVFGEFGISGGIIGRPQHAWHDADLGSHTIDVVTKVRSTEGFDELSEKDQTDILLGALFHDTGKHAYVVDPVHESNSAAIAKSVLQSLGYSPERIQRITDLIPRHSEVSFNPKNPTSQRLEDASYLDNVATQYRKPNAIAQTRILNEADIKSVLTDGSLWKPNVGSELDTVKDTIEPRSAELARNSVPVLTDQLPNSFGIFSLTGDYNVFLQTGVKPSADILKQTPVIESPHYNASATMVNSDGVKPASGLYMMLKAAPERVSQSYPGRLGDTPDGWNGHVDAVGQWQNSLSAKAFAKNIDGQLRRLGFVGDNQTELSSLGQFRRQLSQFDDVNELYAKEGYNSILARANRLVAKQYQNSADAPPNEFWINGPAVGGIAIVRNGKQVFLENADAALGSQQLPEWISTSVPSSDAVVIPKDLWEEARNRDLPIVVLD